MSEIEPVEYRRLAAEHRVTPESWNTFVRDVLAELWLSAYRAALDTPTEILEVPGELTFVFDAQSCLPVSDHEDRTIAVWGRSMTPDLRRDRSRLAGFLPSPSIFALSPHDLEKPGRLREEVTINQLRAPRERGVDVDSAWSWSFRELATQRTRH
jgi:hypothetical protein